MRCRGASLVLLALVVTGSAHAGISAVSAEASTSSVRISWRSDRPAARAVVEIGLTADYGIWSPVVSGAAPSVTIGGLEPATAYRFRIPGAGGAGGRFPPEAIPPPTPAGAT